MTYTLIIPGRLPGLNDYIYAERSNKHGAAQLKRVVETDIMVEAWQQLRGVRFEKPVMMRYRWVEKDRCRDKDNVCFARKFVQDALVKAKVLRGDGWAHVAGFADTFDVDRKNPRVEVEIEETEG